MGMLSGAPVWTWGDRSAGVGKSRSTARGDAKNSRSTARGDAESMVRVTAGGESSTVKVDTCGVRDRLDGSGRGYPRGRSGDNPVDLCWGKRQSSRSHYPSPTADSPCEHYSRPYFGVTLQFLFRASGKILNWSSQRPTLWVPTSCGK